MKAKVRFLRKGHSIDYDTAKYWVNENLYFNIDLKFLWKYTKNYFYDDNNKLYVVDIPYQGKDWSYMRFEGEDGYCVIPTCDYKIEQRLSFNNEDIVEIIDRDQVYDSYYEWVDVNAPQNKKFMWTPGNLPNMKHKFKIITNAPWNLHGDKNDNEWLYFIEDCRTKECFLIDEMGIINATTIE